MLLVNFGSLKRGPNLSWYVALVLFQYLKTSINEGNDTYQPRASVKEVYEDIIANLKEAETLLMPRTDANYQKGHVFSCLC